MGYLRLVHSTPPAPTPENACLAAFDGELGYIFATLKRLGAAPYEAEDLAQEVFVVLLPQLEDVGHRPAPPPVPLCIAFRILCAHRRRRAREILCADVEADDGALSPEGSLQNKQSAALLDGRARTPTHVPTSRGHHA
jgi:DNA-directed RNA polymerase specialized sigma24 family protein